MILLPPPDIPPIQSYIDPGAGSLMLQVLLASFVGGLFMLKVYWRRIKTFVSKVRGKK